MLDNMTWIEMQRLQIFGVHGSWGTVWNTLLIPVKNLIPCFSIKRFRVWDVEYYTSPSPLHPKHLHHHRCSYLAIPIPGPPTPIPPPAADPFTGFMCCPVPGPAAGPPGIAVPIIPTAPGSPPSMLASFPISVSARETGGRRRRVSGQIGGVVLHVTIMYMFCTAIKKNEWIKRGRENRESELNGAPPSPPSSPSSSSSSASAPAGLPPPDVVTGARRAAMATLAGK
ncbi:unnamed protein product [Pleuronectes platessa]|uniref:Uncharacterized protein n=1 Tax=Pleuronectes platessa TaxID=8262 RepID=A0A9N7V4N1_PLEPL|nr:unnamed protein product [Pleuronectes platessa]